MRSPTPEHATGTREILVEAPTASQALAEVTSRLGPRARILEASKVTRGGIGGFFAREMVQLRAHPDAGDAEPAALDAGQLDHRSVTTTAGGETGLDRLLGEAAADVGRREETFGETLRRHLVTGQAPAPLADEAMGFADALAAVRLSVAPAVAHPPPDPRPTAAGPPGQAGWSADRLLRAGVPAALLEGWETPPDDLGGLVAFARLVAPLCGPLPAGPALLAGPRAARLAAALGAATVEVGAPPPAAGTVGVRLGAAERDRAWLAANRGGRWLHLVVGGASWRKLLLDYPLAVSWCGAEALGDALRVASELRLPLAYGCDSARGRGGRVVAATAVDVAVAVRGLVVRS
jgi:hypothetical protein